MALLVKTLNGLAYAGIKTRAGLAVASIKAINGLDATSVAGYAFTETFEGSTADSLSQVGCDNAGWVSSNSGNNPHYATSPAPLAGSYTLLIAAAARTYINDLPVAGGTTVGFYSMLRWTGTQRSSGGLGLSLLDSGSNALCSLESRGSSTWRPVHGTATGSTFTLNVDTTYHIWIEYAKGSGANGVASVYVSTTSTKPGSPTVTLTTGTATADVAKIRLSGFSTTNTFWDNVVADGTQYIGSAPV